MTTEERKQRKIKIGTVVSDKMDKSITVMTERRVPHKLYKKYYKRSRKFLAHDPENTASIGDLVRIMECRPLSRHKSWRLVEILERAK
jgi:small subunit ribosomal protein S17